MHGNRRRLFVAADLGFPTIDICLLFLNIDLALLMHIYGMNLHGNLFANESSAEFRWKFSGNLSQLTVSLRVMNNRN